MTKSEGILFKQIDSDWTLPGRTCFHMAVKDPNAPTRNAKPRESIELRMICFWKEATVDSMPKGSNTTGISENPSSLGIHSASSMQLVGVLLTRLPLVGFLFRTVLSNPLVNTLFTVFQAAFKEYPPYSGNPQDYVARVQQATEAFQHWPSFAKGMVESQLKCKSERVGAEIVTKMIVDDAAGHQKIKKFTANEKKDIVKVCLANKEYMLAIQKQFGKLFAED